jgi:hypothetical protein
MLDIPGGNFLHGLTANDPDELKNVIQKRREV